MSKSVILAFSVAIAAAVVAGLFAAPRAPDEDSGTSAAGRSSARGPAPARAPDVGPGSTPLGTPAVRTGDVEQAMRDLDLIRPSREKPAHDFTLKTADGGTFRLSAHRGKVVFINFWATWCPPCREEMPAMDRLYRKLRDRGLVMVAVSIDADPAVVTPFLREHNLSFTVALDPTMEAANAYAVRALPSSFVVDPNGSMVALALGPRAWDGTAAQVMIAGLMR